MPSTTASRNGASDLTGKVVVEAGRAMLPVLSGKLLAAVADRAVGAVDSLAGRLDDYGAGQRDRSSREEAPAAETGTDSAPARQGVGERSSAVWSMVITQTRVLLDFLMTLLRKAAEFLRTLAARARQRQAPEGTDAELEALEDEDADLDDTDDLDEDDTEDDVDDGSRVS